MISDTFSIRLVTMDDLPAYYSMIDRNRPRLETFFAGTVAATKDPEATRLHLEDVLKKNEKKLFYSFVVVDEASGKLVGSIQLKSFDWNVPKAEVGYYIDAGYEGKGITTRAVSEVVAFGFDTLKLSKLFLRAHPSNTGSVRVAEKNGFEREGLIRRDYRTTDGTLVDVIYYGRVNPGLHE